jgi:hypothetical protein
VLPAPRFNSPTVRNNIIATASLIIPYPNNTAFNTGYFYGFVIQTVLLLMPLLQRYLLRKGHCLPAGLQIESMF